MNRRRVLAAGSAFLGGASLARRGHAEAVSWTETAMLTAGAGAGVDDLFGRSVSLDADRALVGAPRHDYQAEHAGAAYVFEHGDGTTPAPTASATEASADGAGFGVGVALGALGVGALLRHRRSDGGDG